MDKRRRLQGEIVPFATQIPSCKLTELHIHERREPFKSFRISVRPLAVRCATIKPISTKVHSTMISAKPPLRRHSADPSRNRRGTAYSPLGFASPGEALRCSCCGPWC